ncbi:hypothetical protein BAS10_14900 [Elizabethkingia meningoseptica]|uniref:DUF4251 domain-containing protein n=1 Tax=Elizabethkingia meningoseptica TaxID=238 RepID=UPI00099A27E7|nr:DUF4251 domain-containing protein [Elizabethkingia meningoseptica]OPC04363.1 hypothetical protein BAS10_14900 [Elizabethkingia meningoseptica]
MKKRAYIYVLMVAVSTFIVSCASSGKPTDMAKANEVAALVNQDNYTFMATRAYPMDQTTLNVMSAMRPAGGAFRLLDLSYGYGFKLQPNELNVDLPYFGRVFTPSFDTSKNGLKFNSKNFNITKKQDKKKVSYTIRVNDVQGVQALYMDVYNNGKAFLSVNANDRQPISYDGYIQSTKKDDK